MRLPRLSVTVRLLTCAALVAGCERISFYVSTTSSSSSGGADGGPPMEARDATLAAVAACAAELHDAFQGASATLMTSAKAAQNDPSANAEARAAWEEAMDTWQKAELFQIGPTAPSSSPGGLDKRDAIYSWPLVSRCLVEQVIVSKAYQDPGFAKTALINTKGLAAAEYLLFYEGADNDCMPNAAINATGAWDAISPTDLAARKAAYAAAVTAAVAEEGALVAEAWSPSSGDFQSKLAQPGGGGSPYADGQAALNAVSDALFYIDGRVKDKKLAVPLGISGCMQATCLDDVESPYAKVSKRHIRNNLEGLKMILLGCHDPSEMGFDDLLDAVGATDLTKRMKDALAAAIAAADALPDDDLAEEISDDRAKVEALYARIQDLTNILKVEMVSVLNLTLPMGGDGDND